MQRYAKQWWPTGIVVVCLVATARANEEPTAPTAETNRDRKAAEWVISVGGIIEIAQGRREFTVKKESELPDSPFRLIEVNLNMNEKVTDESLAHLAGLTHLRELEIYDTAVSDEGLKHLSDLPALARLNLGRTKITDAGLKHLAGLPKLKALFLFYDNISDEGLIHLGKIHTLQVLHLDDTKVTGSGLKHLKECPLETLSLRETLVTDSGLRDIALFQKLKRLDLLVTDVTDVGLEHLTGNENLVSLELAYTFITDKGTPTLARIENLGSLSLIGTHITDASIEHISRLKKLRSVNLSHSSVTSKGAADLHQALPDCQMSWKSFGLPQSPEIYRLIGYQGILKSEVLNKPAVWHPNGGRYRTWNDGNWTLNGWFLEQIEVNHEIDDPEKITKSLFLFGYDASKKKYVAWAFQSSGVMGQWLGDWNSQSATMTFSLVNPPPNTTAVLIEQHPDDWTVVGNLKFSDDAGQSLMDMVWTRKRQNQIAGQPNLSVQQKWSPIGKPIQPLPKEIEKLKPFVDSRDAKFIRVDHTEGEVIEVKSAEWILDGRFVLATSTTDQRESRIVIGYDSNQKAYRMVRFSTGGQIDEFSGRWNESTGSIDWQSAD